MALMMEALRMFETSVNFCDATWCNIILAAGLEVLKCPFNSTRLHGDILQKVVIFIFAALRT
jgi:hypothetical protein